VTDQGDPFAKTRVTDTGDGERTRAPTGRLSGSGFGAQSGSARGPVPFGTAGGGTAGSLFDDSGILPPGTILNNTQRIEGLIGRGGMGEVYRATNIHTGDLDAIKMIRSDLASDPQVRELFRREAGALRKVRHPAVVSYEGVFGDDIGRLFLVMEFVDGPSLASIIGRAPLSAHDVRRIGVQIAEGLAAAHARGVVHRDLSPDNVVLRGGDLDHAVLIDFGVAKRLDSASTLIGSGFAGKLDYCSPEQCGLYDGVVDHRTDIYSLGLVLAAAAIGKPLPMGSSMARAVKAREVRPDLGAVPADLRRDLERLLEPDPTRRLQSMRDVAAVLGQGAPPVRATPIGGARPGRRLALIGGGVLVLLLLAAAGAIFGPRLLQKETGLVMAPADRAGDVNSQPSPPGDARPRSDDAEQRAAEARRQEAERAASERRQLEDEARRKADADRQSAEDAARRAAAERQAAEDARRRAEDDARREAERRAADDARRKAEDDARREADRVAAEEARRRAEDDARREAERRAAENARRMAEDEARREAERAAAEEARRKAADDARRQAEAEARRKADEARRQPAPPPPPPPPPQPRPQQQAARPPVSAPAMGAEGVWRGTICFRYVMLTQGNETCGPLSLQVAGGAASGQWVVKSVTYGISGSTSGDSVRVTLDMPPAGRNPSLGSKFTMNVHASGNALQGNGRTYNDVLVFFNATR
jgi:hypothetical protein